MVISIDEELNVGAGDSHVSLEALVGELCRRLLDLGGSRSEATPLRLQQIDAIGVRLRCVAADVYRYGTVVRGPHDYLQEVRLGEIEKELVALRGFAVLQQNDQRNRDAHERCPISIRVVCGSGSRDCSAASVGAGQ